MTDKIHIDTINSLPGTGVGDSGDIIQVRADMLVYGIGIMKDGKRIDPWDFYIDESKGTDDE